MKFICFFTILLLSVNLCFSQTWSDPVTVSIGGYNDSPDFTVDKSGTFHCVWSHKITIEHRIIYYSKSTDNGHTWSYPEDISRNSTLWMGEPHIVADSNNHLHVVYDYNLYDYSKTRICYINFDGTKWSTPVFLADSMPGASHNRLAIDHNNKVYCFWFFGKVAYRVLENGLWGKTNQPFKGTLDFFFINKVTVDKHDNLHCIGGHHDNGQSSFDDRMIYFSMVSGIWSNYIEISDTLSWELLILLW